MTLTPRQHQLTARELEVAVLLGQGLRVKEIAAQMGVVHSHVSNCIARAGQKLGLYSRRHLAMWAQKQ
jgi:DNA-binding NarL/FixJ family response regulator